MSPSTGPSGPPANFKPTHLFLVLVDERRVDVAVADLQRMLNRSLNLARSTQPSAQSDQGQRTPIVATNLASVASPALHIHASSLLTHRVKVRPRDMI